MGGFEKQKLPIYDQPRSVGISCANKNCIVHEPMEQPYVRNRFYFLTADTAPECKLRCVYCENDIEDFVGASKKNKWYASEAEVLLREAEHSFKRPGRVRDEAKQAPPAFTSPACGGQVARERLKSRS